MKKRRDRAVEWIGGISTVAAYVTGEGEPYRPELLVWMDEAGAIVGTITDKPGELLRQASASLQAAMTTPMKGRPRAPDRVRVADPGLADALRAGHPDIAVITAPTPEIDMMMALMLKTFPGAGDDGEVSYLDGGATSEAVGAFFAASAELYRVAPWNVIDDSRSILSLTCPSLGLRDAIVAVIGQMGETLGWILFEGIYEFRMYLHAAEVMDQGEAPPRMPPMFALNFERGADLAGGLRKEISAHGWPVAGPSAYPTLLVVDGDLVTRPPSPQDFARASLVSRALSRLIGEENERLQGGASFERTYRLSLYEGEFEASWQLTSGAPVGRAVGDEAKGRSVRQVLEELRDFTELSPDAQQRLNEELLDAFSVSPEAQALAGVEWAPLIMDLAGDYFGVSVGTIEPTELRRILDELIPRRLSVDPSQASLIIRELRALFDFLGREGRVIAAERCRKLLTGAAAKRLEKTLSDPRDFGLAKSLVMSGCQAGFDMESRTGLEAFLATVSGQPLSGQIPLFGGKPKTRRATTGTSGRRSREPKASLTPPRWMSLLAVVPKNLTLDHLRAFRPLYESIPVELTGAPRNVLRVERAFRFLYLYAWIAHREQRYAPLNRGWDDLRARFGADPRYEDGVFLESWLFMDFPLTPQGRTLLDEFADFCGPIPDAKAELGAFIESAKASRLGLHQEIASTGRVTKYKELFTNRVTSTLRSIEHYEHGEIFLGRIIESEGDRFLLGDPKCFPPAYRERVEGIVAERFLSFPGATAVEKYERFMKLAGPHWMSFVAGDTESEIIDPKHWETYHETVAASVAKGRSARGRRPRSRPQ